MQSNNELTSAPVCTVVDRDLLLEELNGEVNVANRGIFTDHLDPKFKEPRFNKAGKATPQAVFEIHEAKNGLELASIVGIFSDNLEKICMTQHQVVMFCIVHYTKLKWYAPSTHFVFAEGGEYFLARVEVHFHGLSMFLHECNEEILRNLAAPMHLVLPQE